MKALVLAAAILGGCGVSDDENTADATVDAAASEPDADPPEPAPPCELPELRCAPPTGSMLVLSAWCGSGFGICGPTSLRCVAHEGHEWEVHWWWNRSLDRWETPDDEAKCWPGGTVASSRGECWASSGEPVDCVDGRAPGRADAAGDLFLQDPRIGEPGYSPFGFTIWKSGEGNPSPCDPCPPQGI